MSQTAFPKVLRGTAEYEEVTRILGPKKCRQVLDESAVQISCRYFTADVIVSDMTDPAPLELNANGSIKTRRQRFRIPQGSLLARPGRRR